MTVNSTGSAEIQINSDTNANTGGPWEVELEVNSADGLFQIGPVGGTAEPFRLEFDAPEDSLRINRIRQYRNWHRRTHPGSPHLHGRFRVFDWKIPTTYVSWYVKNSNAGRFEIAEVTGGTNPFTIDSGAPDGALHVASNGFVGIGTATPQRRLHILGNHIRIENAGSTWDLNPGSQGIWFNRAIPAGVFGILKLQNDAPANSIACMRTQPELDWGPLARHEPLHVSRTDGTAGVLVEETQAIDLNPMLTMTHNGNTGFQFNNTRDGSTWQFRTLGPSGTTTNFVITKQGTGGAEFSLEDDGDLVADGQVFSGSSRSIKTGIATMVEPADILTKVERLNIHEWAYSRSPSERHIGPMAEDFARNLRFRWGRKTYLA